MNTLRTLAILLAAPLAAFAAESEISTVSGITVPKLEEVLKYKAGRTLMFQPVTLARSQSLEVRHIRFGDGSVRPGEERQAMLVIYAATPDIAGQHAVLAAEVKSLAPGASPVITFERYSPDSDGRGIIAILIGLLKNSSTPNAPARTAPLPPSDVVAAEIIDGTSNTLLLPAVQKVRQAAQR
jgi:hypothetical protein